MTTTEPLANTRPAADELTISDPDPGREQWARELVSHLNYGDLSAALIAADVDLPYGTNDLDLVHTTITGSLMRLGYGQIADLGCDIRAAGIYAAQLDDHPDVTPAEQKTAWRIYHHLTGGERRRNQATNLSSRLYRALHTDTALARAYPRQHEDQDTDAYTGF